MSCLIWMMDLYCLPSSLRILNMIKLEFNIFVSVKKADGKFLVFKLSILRKEILSSTSMFGKFYLLQFCRRKFVDCFFRTVRIICSCTEFPEWLHSHYSYMNVSSGMV